MRRKQQGYEVKTACVQTGPSPLGEVRERSRMIYIQHKAFYSLQLCIFDLSPVSPKGEKQFVLLTKKNGDNEKILHGRKLAPPL